MIFLNQSKVGQLTGILSTFTKTVDKLTALDSDLTDEKAAIDKRIVELQDQNVVLVEAKSKISKVVENIKKLTGEV